jgi:hypothetical protein
LHLLVARSTFQCTKWQKPRVRRRFFKLRCDGRSAQLFRWIWMENIAAAVSKRLRRADAGGPWRDPWWPRCRVMVPKWMIMGENRFMSYFPRYLFVDHDCMYFGCASKWERPKCATSVGTILRYSDFAPNFSGGSGWRTLPLLCLNDCTEQTQVAHGGIHGGRGGG